MNKYIVVSLLSFLSFFKVVGQEEYIGLSRSELKTLSIMAVNNSNSEELLRLNAYQNFLNDLDTLYQVFSSKLSAKETSLELKKQLNERLIALDDLSYFGRKYREHKRAGDQVEAQLSLSQYYLSLEKLELKDYFMTLGSNGPVAETDIEPRKTFKAKANGSKLNFYLGMGLNYSLVSYSNEQLDPALLGPGVSINHESKGGLSRVFYLGASYQFNPDFSSFLEVGWSGQNLNSETTLNFLDPFQPGRQESFITRRMIQHRYTDLKFGAAYSLDKLNIRLGLQLSFLNSFDMNFEQVQATSGNSNSQEYDPELEYGFTKTRSFLIIGADYPVYDFSFDKHVFFIDAYFQTSLGLSSVLDEEAEPDVNLFNEMETLNNSLLHLGLRLRL